MTTDEINAKLNKGYNDMEKGNFQEAAAAFKKFREYSGAAEPQFR